MADDMGWKALGTSEDLGKRKPRMLYKALIHEHSSGSLENCDAELLPLVQATGLETSTTPAMGLQGKSIGTSNRFICLNLTDLCGAQHGDST